MTLNNFMTFIAPKKNPKVPTSLSPKHYIHVSMNYELLFQVLVTVNLVTETQIVWSSKCWSRRPGVTLIAWMSQNWKKMYLQEHQEFTKCLKSKCSKDEFLNNAWPKKKAGVIKSLHPQVHWYTEHVQLVQYELGPFFLLSKKPGVFTM